MVNKTWHRQTFTGHTALLEELPHLGYDRCLSAVPAGLHPHRHRGAFEICYLAKGCVQWWTDQDVYEVGPKHVYVTLPNQLHGGIDAVLHPCTLYWLHVKIPSNKPWPDMTLGQTRLLRKRLLAIQSLCFSGSNSLSNYFVQLHQAHLQGDSLSAVRSRALLRLLVFEVLDLHDVHAQSQPQISPAIAKAITWMTEHITQDFTIDQASSIAQMSMPRFYQRFSQEVGHSPGEWRQVQRVNLSKRLLLEGQSSIIDVAMRVGFASSQYFATAFKKRVGLSPSAYRKRRHILP